MRVRVVRRIVYAFRSGMLSVSIQILLVLSITKSEMALRTSLNTAFRTSGRDAEPRWPGLFLSTYVIGTTTLPTTAAFQYCFYVAVIAFIVMGLISTLARKVIGKVPPRGDLTEVVIDPVLFPVIFGKSSGQHRTMAPTALTHTPLETRRSNNANTAQEETGQENLKALHKGEKSCHLKSGEPPGIDLNSLRPHSTPKRRVSKRRLYHR